MMLGARPEAPRIGLERVPYPVPDAPVTLFVDEALLDCSCPLCSVAVGAGVAVGTAVAVGCVVALAAGDFTVADGVPVEVCEALYCVERDDAVADGAGVAVAVEAMLATVRTVFA
jgi:hypothetical protein